MINPVFPLLFLSSVGLCLVGAGLIALGGWEAYGADARVLLGLGTVLPLVGAAAWIGHGFMQGCDLLWTNQTRFLTGQPRIRTDAVPATRQGTSMLVWAAGGALTSLLLVVTLCILHAILVGHTVQLLVIAPLALFAWFVPVAQPLHRAWVLGMYPTPDALHARLDAHIRRCMAHLIAHHQGPVGDKAEVAIEWVWSAQGYTAVRADVVPGLPDLLAKLRPPPHTAAPDTDLDLPRGSLWPTANDREWRGLGIVWPFIRAQTRDAVLTSAHDRMRTLQQLYANDAQDV